MPFDSSAVTLLLTSFSPRGGDISPESILEKARYESRLHFNLS